MSRQNPLWYRLTLILTSFRPSIGVGSVIMILAGTPMILWWVMPHRYIVDWLSEQAMTGLLRDPYVQSLDPERQAAIPKRIADVLWAAYPKFAALGLAAGIAAGAVYVIIARLLSPVFPKLLEPHQASPSLTRGSVLQWVTPILVSLMGFVAHVPYLELSLNLDEAKAVQGLMSNGWYWADTRWGWQIHVGGLLLVRLFALPFGYGPWAVRLPAALFSSAALGVLYSWVRSLHGNRVALLTSGVVALWPTWAEQCATARGYGLSFACGVLAVVSLWRLLEEDRPHFLSPGMAVWLLFFAVLFGSLAHFFWMFFGFACFLFLCWKAYFAREVHAAAAALFTLAALFLAGLVYAPGLASTLFQMKAVAREGLVSEIGGRFIQAFGFRGEWPTNIVITFVIAALGTAGLLLLPRRESFRILLILLVAIALPVSLQPVYLYPRFFLHLCFLWYVPMLPIGLISDRLFRPRLALAAATALLAAGVFWVRPWMQLPMVDIQSLASYCQATEKPGEPYYLDAILQPASIYPLGSQTKFVSFSRGIPPTARRIVRCFSPQQSPLPLPDGFHRIKSFPGWEANIEVLSR